MDPSHATELSLRVRNLSPAQQEPTRKEPVRSKGHLITNQSTSDGTCASSPLPSRKKRDVAKDMEALILSRQDDPFLQALASRESKADEVECQDDSTSLIPTPKDGFSACSRDGSLTVSDVHEHMIRSPPPSMFSVGNVVFQFPGGSKDTPVKKNV